MTQIVSSGVTKNGAIVDSDGKLQTRSVSESEAQFSTELGEAFNLNTGTIALTSTTESAIFYYKHNEDKDFLIEAIAVGVGSAGTTTDVSTITIIRNPTAGTIVSGATDVDMNANRDFSTGAALTSSLAYKGAEGNTFTDGEDFAQFYQPAGGRLFAEIGLRLKKGNSIGIKIDTQTSGGTTNVYAALVTHLKEV